jgi:RHH-type transcriptional regulator, rel operon repressor / antitoxin RelB
MTIAVRLPKELEIKLDQMATITHRSKSYYIRKALENFFEDREDYLIAAARLEEKNDRIPYKKMRKDLGLDD